MTEPVSSIRNMGPASDSGFGRAGINTAEELRALGPDEAYFKYLSAGGKPHFIGYYAMVMGLQGRPWNDCRDEEKEALKQRFTAIKARVKQQGPLESGLDHALREIGIMPPATEENGGT